MIQVRCVLSGIRVKHAEFLMFLGVALVLARPIVLCKAFHVVVRRMMSVESRQHQNVDGWGICIGIAGAKSRCTNYDVCSTTSQRVMGVGNVVL